MLVYKNMKGGISMWQFWLILSGIFFVFEMATVGFLIFWLGVGALLAMIVSFFVDNVIIQTAVFVISSIALIFLTKPFVKKLATPRVKVKTNAYSIIGKNAIVTKEINSHTGKIGQIKVGGDTWSAKADMEETIIPVNTEVKILRIDGVKAVVSTDLSAEPEIVDDESI